MCTSISQDRTRFGDCIWAACRTTPIFGSRGHLGLAADTPTSMARLLALPDDVLLSAMSTWEALMLARLAITCSKLRLMLEAAVEQRAKLLNVRLPPLHEGESLAHALRFAELIAASGHYWLAAGYWHSLRADRNSVFAWGGIAKDDYQAPNVSHIGHVSADVAWHSEREHFEQPNILAPARVTLQRCFTGGIYKELSTSVRGVAAGPKCSILVDADGAIWYWGLVNGLYMPASTSTEATFGRSWRHCRPQQWPCSGRADFKVVQASCGLLHLLLLLDDGRVFSSGDGNFGRLGHGDELRQAAPHVVNALSAQRMCCISAGTADSMAVSEHGELFTWGCGTHGKLGLATQGRRSPSLPCRVDAFAGAARISLISSGGGHAVALDHQGQLYAWGCGAFGELGLGRIHSGEYPNHQIKSELLSWPGLAAMRPQNWPPGADAPPLRCVDVPQLVASPSGGPILQAAAGHHHTMLVAADGCVYTCGKGLGGRLGTGSEENVYSPRALPSFGEAVIEVAAGKRHSLVRTRTGRVFAFGSGSEGQLGQGDERPSSCLPLLIV
jgi:alpha-tubulin suppressor-like RCC1 family protein